MKNNNTMASDGTGPDQLAQLGLRQAKWRSMMRAVWGRSGPPELRIAAKAVAATVNEPITRNIPRGAARLATAKKFALTALLMGEVEGCRVQVDSCTRMSTEAQCGSRDGTSADGAYAYDPASGEHRKCIYEHHVRHADATGDPHIAEWGCAMIGARGNLPAAERCAASAIILPPSGPGLQECPSASAPPRFRPRSEPSS